MTTPRILLCDHGSAADQRLAAALQDAGYEVLRPSPHGADDVAARDVDLVLGEVPSGDLEGGRDNPLLEALRLPDGPEVILLEDFALANAAYEALRAEAFDTIARPIADADVLRVVRRALEHRTLVAENRRLREAETGYRLGELVSRDPRMGHVFELLRSIADSSANLLIQGESGTGKTVLARAVHDRSNRAAHAFVAVNCGAIPGSLLESELFGHARGAFTGASRDRVGRFEAADGGTIFLDEIGTASPDLQVKLLRVVEEGAYERVGEATSRHVDARLIAATNADLEREVEAGRFRADLFYRLDVIGVEIPPLRARVCDVPLLAERFLHRFVERHGRDVEGIASDALAALCAHDWPGNVRELENTIERAVLFASGRLLSKRNLWPGGPPTAAVRAPRVDDREPEERDAPVPRPHPTAPREFAAPKEDTGPADGTQVAPASEPPAPRLEELPIGPLKEVLGGPERWLIERALRAHGGSRQDTARALGINRTTLFNKMRKYDLLDFPTWAP